MLFEQESEGRATPEGQRPMLRSPRRIDAEHFNLALILNLIRTGNVTTRQEVEKHSGLGRAIVTDRLQALTSLGLIQEGNLAPSTGGRAPRYLQFCNNAGTILLAVIGQSTIGVGSADLSGNLLIEHHESVDDSLGASATLKRIFTLFDWVLEQNGGEHNVWGIGVAVAAPVESSPGQPFTSPTLHFMPGWDEYQFVEHLAARYGAPVWVRSSVQMMTLGEQRAGTGRDIQNMIFVDLGREIAAGIVSDGSLQTGSQGCAGMIGHMVISDDNSAICRCGNIGCLETIAGADAVSREALRAAREGRSLLLAETLASTGELTSTDVGSAAQLGDTFSAELMTRCGRSVGAALAALTNALNPSIIIVGGALAQASDILLAAIREAVYRKSHPLITRDLRVVRSQLGSSSALNGAAMIVVEELLSTAALSFWVAHGSPIRHPQVARLLAKARETTAFRETKPRPPETAHQTDHLFHETAIEKE